MPITLEEFIAKAKRKEESKIKLIMLQVEGFGEIEFQRPSESNILKFSNGMLAAAKGVDLEKSENENETIEKEKMKIENIDIAAFAKTASEFIYNSCSFMRDAEIRKMYKNVYPADIPLCILGQTETITLATKIFEEFNGKKQVEEIEEDLKN